jgi:uncharacterized protein (DUF2252 family)
MFQSAFAYFRGTALIQAHDLKGTPSGGINVHACGDCHLMNFGGFATPERNLIFDINDFDETLPAPSGVHAQTRRDRRSRSVVLQE